MMSQNVSASRTARRSNLKEMFIDFPLYLMGHPFKGFYDMKAEGRGNNIVPTVLILLNAFIAILRFVYTGFIANPNEPYDLNVLLILAGQIAPILLFVIGNWSTTTLMEGSGSLSDIYQVIGYSLYLTIPLNLVSIFMTNLLIREEMRLALFFATLATVIFVIYAFIGLVVVHEFTLMRAIGALILTFFAMLIILFLLLLGVTLMGEVYLFISTIYQELVLHLT